MTPPPFPSTQHSLLYRAAWLYIGSMAGHPPPPPNRTVLHKMAILLPTLFTKVSFFMEVKRWFCCEQGEL